MANAVIMPKAGITVESCIISEWLKKPGDKVEVGDVLFTYETDKASFECESTAAGTLLECFYGNGDEVVCLENVCAIGEEGEDVSALRPGGAAASPAPAAPAAEAPAAAPAPAAEAAAPAATTNAKAVIMPKAGITVESCIISEWLKKPGDRVEVGDILFTYETDKANFECESTEAGTLLECFYGDGDEVVCLENVCAIGEPGDDPSPLRPGGAAPAAAAEEAAPAAAAPAAAAAVPVAAEGRQAVSPRAKGLAERSGTDLATVAGTGPNGRVIERDVRRVMAEGPDIAAAAASPEPEEKAAPAAAAAPAAPEADTEYEDVKFSGIRKVIAKSMSRSLTELAQLTHNFTFDATALKKYRAMLKTCDGDTAKITLGDMILYAVSRTLKECPDLNALMLEENVIRRYKHVNLGVAVDTDRGLMVPTIFKADTKSLLEISREVKELAAMCRSGSISPDLLAGGTFTVSNLGSYGVESFTPVINAPQTGILGVCTIVERPRKAADGGIEMYPAMGLSLTYDHRATDGGPASRYMQILCRKLENFTALLAE